MTDTRPRYNYQGSVAQVWKCRAREILYCGPARTGKTRGDLEKALLYGMKYPKARILFIRKTRASMSETVLQTFEDDVLPPAWKGNTSRAHREKYVLPNGSEIVTGGMDHTDKILSSEYDLIIAFEATEFTEEDFGKLLSRLSGKAGPYQQIIAECNPSSPSHWLKRRADAGKMVYIASSHKDNPRWYDPATDTWTPQGLVYQETLDSLTGHLKARLKDGVWASAEGLVYPEFDRDVHVIPAMPKGWESWRKIRTVDFGYNHPFVCQWWAIDPDGRMYLYREIYRTNRTVRDHTRQIVRQSEGEQYEATIADHDREDRATMEQEGITTIPARKDIESGVQAVRDRLRCAGDGKPRIYFVSGATLEIDPALEGAKRPVSTVSEFDGYVWAKNRDGSMMKEVPIKEMDDGMDAMRYAVMHIDGGEALPSLAWVGAPARGGRSLDDIDRWFDE